jgi:Mlc titration factor MtfA (ptsG expression regulator)
MLNWFKNRRRKRILRTPWPSSWDSILTNNVGHFKKLSAIEKNKLKTITKVMVSEKNWEAHGGLVMSDEIKITISGTAALLLLGVDGFHFDRVNTIIVFPHPIRRETQDGLIVGRESRHAGEAWQGGQVILSWQDVVSDSRNAADGSNLVIHEFAHCLDGLDGEMGGNLTFDDPATALRWQQVCASEFEALGAAAQRGQSTLLDYYGATNLAEFFAVCSETFFEKPRQLKHEHSELFDLLVNYYHVDPVKWT